MSAKAPIFTVLEKLTAAKDWLEHARARTPKINGAVEKIFFEKITLTSPNQDLRAQNFGVVFNILN